MTPDQAVPDRETRAQRQGRTIIWEDVDITAARLPPGAKDSPWDECCCGDFRSDHDRGKGPCRYRDHHIPDPDLNVCSEFRLFARAGYRERMHEVLVRQNRELAEKWDKLMGVRP